MPKFLNLPNMKNISSSVASFGNFDGIHIGHNELIKKIIFESKKHNCKSTLITFNPNTKKIIAKDKNFKEITPYEEKLNILKTFKLDYVITIPFDLEFSKINPDDFISTLMNSIELKLLILGYDNKFGNKGLGDFNYLNKYIKKNNLNFHINLFDEYKLNGQNVKSSLIKHYINNGNIKKTNKLLKRNFYINGYVVEGNGIGKTLGFPTANIKLKYNQQILPMHGVYYVNLELDNAIYKGLCNIGVRPSFNCKDKEMSIEIHILNFNNNIYNKEVKIFFLDFIRNEIKFNSKNDLIEQINKDIKAI